MAFPRFLRGNERHVTETDFSAPHPISVATQPIIDANATRTFAIPRTGAIRWGLNGSRELRWNGDLGPLQRWRGLTSAVHTVGLRGPNIALPATSPPAINRSAVLEVIEQARMR